MTPTQPRLLTETSLITRSPSPCPIANPVLTSDPDHVSSARDEEPLEIRSPMEGHSSYRGRDWRPERLLLHQNLESFAERVGLIVAMQGSGKISQDRAFSAIKKLWKELRNSRDAIQNSDRS